MITRGLKGEMSIMSGNAIYIGSMDKLIEFPDNVEWKGTLIYAEIPLNPPATFNLYNYIA